MIRLLSTWAWTDNSIYHITLRVTFDLRKWKGHLSLNISYLTGAAEPTVAKAFLGQGRILAEYHWWIQYIRPFGLGTTLSFHLSTSLDLHCHLFRHPMSHLLDASKQRRSGHPFKIGESQTSTITTSCLISLCKIIAFTTSTFSSFCSSYILAHLQVFHRTITRHTIKLVWAQMERSECSYMSNTSG